MTENKNRLDAAICDAAQASIEAPSDESDPLRAALIERHGPLLAPLVADLEANRRAELRERFQGLQAQLAVARQALELREQEGARLLAPLEGAMETARRVWEEHCAAFERRRIQNQSDLVPLRNRIAAIITALNQPAPGFGVRGFRQWEIRDWARGLRRDDGT